MLLGSQKLLLFWWDGKGAARDFLGLGRKQEVQMVVTAVSLYILGWEMD